MNVEVKSSEVEYTITYTELCKLLKIPDTKDIDFLDLKLDPSNELVIINQIEPPHITRPKGANEK